MIERYHDTDTPGVFVREKIEDLSAAVQGVKDQRELLSGKPVDGLGYYVGSIPPIVAEDYCQKHGITWVEFCGNDDHIKRILADPDLSAFRVWQGHL